VFVSVTNEHQGNHTKPRRTHLENTCTPGWGTHFLSCLRENQVTRAT